MAALGLARRQRQNEHPDHEAFAHVTGVWQGGSESLLPPSPRNGGGGTSRQKHSHERRRKPERRRPLASQALLSLNHSAIGRRQINLGIAAERSGAARLCENGFTPRGWRRRHGKAAAAGSAVFGRSSSTAVSCSRKEKEKNNLRNGVF